jgi:hypothetical protein
MQIRSKSAQVRVQLDLPADRITELEELMAKTGVTTRKDLFENALTLFEWAVNQRAQGRNIASVCADEESYRELVMPALAYVKHDAKNSRNWKTEEAAKGR